MQMTIRRFQSSYRFKNKTQHNIIMTIGALEYLKSNPYLNIKIDNNKTIDNIKSNPHSNLFIFNKDHEAYII